MRLLATHAELLLRHGYELFPLKPNNKTPLLQGWRTADPLTAAQAAATARVGVRLTDKQLVVDVDRHDGRPHGVAPPELLGYPTVETPHGVHIYCALPDGFSGRLRHTLPDRPGIEFKTIGRYVVAPWQSGYEWAMHSVELPAPVVPDSILQSILQAELVAGVAEGEWSPAELAAALEQLDPQDFREHDPWFSLMCACHEATAGSGLEEFVRWSVGDEPYRADARIIRSRWATLTTGRAGNAGMGTLLKVLASHGADPPPSVRNRAAMGDFGEVANETDDILTERPPSAMILLDKKYKVVDDAGRLRIYSVKRNETLGRLEWDQSTRQDFIDIVKSVLQMSDVAVGQTAKGAPKFVPAGVAFLDYYKKTTYTGVVFMPEHDDDRTPEGRLNLWRGFAVEESDAGDWEYMKEMVYETLCDSDSASYEYVMNWLAVAVQRPWEPAGVALVLKGPKGVGKSTLGKYFARLFGSHGMHVSSKELLTGRFNAHLMDTVALFADEAFWAGDKNGEGVFKALVTERTLAYEAKGKNPTSGRNCLHIMVGSNEDWVVPAGMDGERRFAVLEAVDGGQSRSYWNILHDKMKNGGLARMLWELRRRDISHFDIFAVPRTRALSDQKLQTMGAMASWLYDAADSGWVDFGDSKDGLFEVVEVYHSYLRACDRRNIRSQRASMTALGMGMRKYLPEITKKRVLTSPGTQRSFYQMPDAAESRKKLEALLGLASNS